MSRATARRRGSIRAPVTDTRALDSAAVDWPPSLRELRDAPTTLRVLGELGDLSRAIAIVGTRRATPHAMTFARGLARALAEEGHVVVSGGATGIDTAAHEGALAISARTVVVLPTGLASPYPARNRALFAEVVERGGALVTEMPDDAPVHRASFLARNRIIAALARATIVVQAPFASGAMSTAAHARALGRAVLAAPWAVDDPYGEGCNELLARGARVCRGAADVLEALGAPRPRRPPRRAARRRLELGPDEESLLAALGPAPQHPDALAIATGLPIARIQTMLLSLVLLGQVESHAGGYRTA